MANNRVSIEVAAQGNFSQLLGGLNQVQRGLQNVTNVINTPPKNGGLFDINNYRQQRNSNTGASRGTSTGAGVPVTVSAFGTTALNQLAQILQRAQQQPTTPNGGRSGGGSGGNGNGGGGGGSSLTALLGGKGGGLLKGVLGTMASIAGISLGINQLLKWEQMAESRDTSWQPLIQRTGVNRGTMEGVGLGYGYNTMQTRGILDAYTQMGGNIGAGQLGSLLAFSRGYGLDATTVGAISGQYAQLGYGAPSTTLGNIAGSAEASGMVPRILEVLESGLGFLKSMDTNLKDNSGNSLLAYTTRINQIGTQDGYQKLTGQNGASIMEQMGSNIFSPSNTRWQAIGMNALKRYGGKATANMSALDLLDTWSQGFSNPANIGALSSYMANETKGMNPKDAEALKTFIMQNAMGGNTSYATAKQFGQATNWLQKISPNDPTMKALLNGGNASGNTSGVGVNSQVGPKSMQWQGTIAARIEISNAAWMQKQIEAGELLIPAKLELQDLAGDVLDQVTKGLKDASDGSGPGLIADAIGALIGWNLLKNIPKLLFGGPPAPKGGGGGDGAPKGTTPVEEEPVKPAEGGGEVIKGPWAGSGEPAGGGLWNTIKGWGGKSLRFLGEAFTGIEVAQDAQKITDSYRTPDGRTLEEALGGKKVQKNSDDQTKKIDKFQKDGNQSLQGMADATDNKFKRLAYDTTKTFGDLKDSSTKQFQTMAQEAKSSFTDMTKVMLASDLMSRNPGKYTDKWYAQLDPKNPLSWMNFGATDRQGPQIPGQNVMGPALPPQNQVQQQVYDALQKRGQGGLWNNVQWLINHEDGSWDPSLVHPTVNPYDGDHPRGLFGFMPNTWSGYGYSGTPDQASVDQQVQAFLKRFQSAWGGDFKNIPGFGTSSYHGWADGTYVQNDRLGIVHGGEEILSRAKTAEVRRKTGKLPSQVLNGVMNGTMGGSGYVGGRIQHTHTVHITSDGSLSGVQVATMQQVAREVFSEIGHTEQRQNPYF